MASSYFWSVLLSLVFCFTQVCHAQPALTNGQAFDFDIGDVFMGLGTTINAASPSTPPTTITKKILGKALSPTAVTYTMQIDYYTPPACPTCSAISSSTIMTTTINNLSSAVIHNNQTSACLGTKDTLYYDYCNKLTSEVHPLSTDSCFEPTSHTTLFVEGAGGPYYSKTVMNAFSGPLYISFTLLYYAKQSGTCGSTFINEADEQMGAVSVYPNPAGDYLNLISNTPLSYYSIFDLSGKLCRADVVQNNRMETAGLARGIYIANFYTLGSRVRTVKIVKE